MNILHVANLGDNKASGINIAVPQHMKFQAKYANIGFYNFRETAMPIDIDIKILSNGEKSKFDLTKFEEPFNRPDLVIFHDVFSSLKFCNVAKILYRMNIPYVVVPHGSFAYNAIRRRKTKKVVALHTIMRTLVYKSNAVQYLTEEESNNSYVKNNSIIVPNGITIPEAFKIKKTNDGGIRFVYIGRKDIYYKGIDCLLSACKLACDSFRTSGATLTLYGPDLNGSFRTINKMIKEFQISDFVFNRDGVFGVEKARILEDGSVFVLTSRTEGQPLSLLEACSYGLPVLITPGTNLSDKVNHYQCGWVAKQSVDSIAEKLIYIIDNPQEIQEYSQNMHDYVSKMSTWEKVAIKAIEEYRAIILSEKIRY